MTALDANPDDIATPEAVAAPVIGPLAGDPSILGLGSFIVGSIALGLGWLVGELTGCGRFAATCDDSADPILLGLQLAILAILLVLPALASVATMAALTLIGGSLAAALILSATGAAADSDSRRMALAVVLLAAWLAGLAIAIMRRVRALSPPTRPVS